MERWQRKPMIVEVVEWKGNNGAEVEALALKYGLQEFVSVSKSGNSLSVRSSSQLTKPRTWGADIGDRVVVQPGPPPAIFLSREKLFYLNYEPLEQD